MNNNNETVNNTQMREIWLRLGVLVKLTKDEEKTILGTDKEAAVKTLSKAITDGRVSINGNTYIPETCVDDFNKKYNTNHTVGDVDMDIDDLQLTSASKISNNDSDNADIYILCCCNNQYPIPNLPNRLPDEYEYGNYAFEGISISAFKTEKDVRNALILIAENEYPKKRFYSIEEITGFLRTLGQNGDDVFVFSITKISN